MDAVRETSRDAQRRAERLSVLNAVSRLVSSRLRVDEVLDEVVRAAQGLLETDHVHVWILDPDREELHLSTRSSPWFDAQLRTLPLKGSLAGEVLCSGEVYQIANVLDDPRWMNREATAAAKLQGYLGVPLIAGGESLGVLSILCHDRRVYSEEDLDLMRAFAAQAAVAIANARLFGQAERRARRLAAWSEASRLVTSSLDLDVVLAAVVRSAKEVIDVDRARLWALDEATDEVVLMAASDGDVEGQGWITRMRTTGTLLGLVLTSGDVLQTPDILEYPLVQNRSYMEAEGLHGYIAVPLQLKERPFGVLVLFSRDRRYFQEDEVEVLRALGQQAAVAIENARLYQLQAKQTARLVALHNVAATRLSSVRQDDLLRSIVLDATRLIGAECGVVYLWHPETGTLQPSEGIHVGPTEHRHLPLRPDQGITGRAFSQRRVQLVDDFHARPNALDCQVRALIAAPLLTTDDVLGVISVSTHAPDRHFDQDDARLLELIAAQISVGLENIRLFDVVGQIEALRELDRLKTEFLSTVSHELRTPLSYIHGYAELLLTRELTRAEVSEMAREIHRGSTSMVRLVDDLLDVSRIESGHFSLQVAPTRIEDLLRSLASVFRVQADHHSITLDLPDGLLPTVLVDSARARQVLSNLLSNAVQYSPGGGEIVVGARAERRHVRVEIRDQGSGIPSDEQQRVWERFYRGRHAVISAHRGSGLGLAIVKHLVEAHGGEVGVDSVVGQGSTFWLTLPTAGVGSRQ